MAINLFSVLPLPPFEPLFLSLAPPHMTISSIFLYTSRTSGLSMLINITSNHTCSVPISQLLCTYRHAHSPCTTLTVNPVKLYKSCLVKHVDFQAMLTVSAILLHTFGPFSFTFVLSLPPLPQRSQPIMKAQCQPIRRHGDTSPPQAEEMRASCFFERRATKGSLSNLL